MVRKLLLIISFIPACLLQAQSDSAHIELQLDGLRTEERNNYYNAKEVSYFNEDGHKLYTISYDADGNIEEDPTGIAVVQYLYDKRGNKIEQAYFDERLKRYRTEMVGPAIMRYKYDSANNQTEIRFLNEFGELLNESFSLVRMKYDEKGCKVEERSYNHKEEMVGRRPIERYKCDSLGRTIETRVYDRFDQLIVSDQAIRKEKYDSYNRITQIRFFNQNEEPADGVATVIFNYDVEPEKNPLEDLFKEANGEAPPPVKWREVTTYDKTGKQLKRKKSTY